MAQSVPSLSIITHFYNQPELVLRQIAHWETMSAEVLDQVEFIIVDDCSEQVPIYPATRLDLKAFRISTPITWNQGGARNLATIHARASWALYFDIDGWLFGEPLANILQNVKYCDENMMYHPVYLPTPQRDHDQHVNTFLVNLPRFKLNGMYDEDFAGYYGYEDNYMLKAWESRVGRRTVLTGGPYFEDVGAPTLHLDRDDSRNLQLGYAKMTNGFPKSPAILRFNWEYVDVPRSF